MRQIPWVPLGPAKGSTEIITTPTGRGNWLCNENNGKIRLDTDAGVKDGHGNLISGR